jgi:hypothetical protein
MLNKMVPLRLFACTDFGVTHPQIDFDVECKHVSVDAFRKIRRRDFYKLAEMLIAPIEERSLSGSVDIVLEFRRMTAAYRRSGAPSQLLFRGPAHRSGRL